MALFLRMLLLLTVLALPACSGGGDGGGPEDSTETEELTPEQIEYEKNLNRQ